MAMLRASSTIVMAMVLTLAISQAALHFMVVNTTMSSEMMHCLHMMMMTLVVVGPGCISRGSKLAAVGIILVSRRRA
jgi:hypothetical protein